MRCESFQRLSVRNRSAFTVAELLVSMTVMSLIVFALYTMFAQTQKALRSNIGQVDVLESGRMTMEMISREMAQITASGEPHMTNLSARIGLNITPQQSPAAIYSPFSQEDPIDSTRVLRTNILQDIFFLREETYQWIGTGYRVIGKMDPGGTSVVPANPAVGTLYRISYSAKARDFRTEHRAPSPAFNDTSSNFTNFFKMFMEAPLIGGQVQIWDERQLWTISTNYSRILDGVVHFRLTAFDALGRPLHWYGTNTMSYYKTLRLNSGGGRLNFPYTLGSVVDAVDANVVLQQESVSALAVDETKLTFKNNALPAYVELELGVVEPVTFKQYESVREGLNVAQQNADQNPAKNFLRKAGSKVHIFRERIPIRTVTQ